MIRRQNDCYWAQRYYFFAYFCKKNVILKNKNLFSLPISHEKQCVQDEIQSLLAHSPEILREYWNYLFTTQGKLIRSAFLLSVSKILNKTNSDTLRSAALVELIHQASLIHDDVIDQSDTRRYKKSVPALWGNQLAVLLGDLLYTLAMELAIETPKAVQKEILTACRLMTEGEILQHKSILSDSKAVYFQIIERKTGALFAAACAMAAICAECSESEVSDWRNFGLTCGVLFQIRDDLMDFLPEKQTGKPAFKDLSDQKLTLPVLETLSILLPEDKIQFLNQIQSFSESNSEQIMQTLHETKGLENAQQEIRNLSAKALEFLMRQNRCEAAVELEEIIKELSNKSSHD